MSVALACYGARAVLCNKLLRPPTTLKSAARPFSPRGGQPCPDPWGILGLGWPPGLGDSQPPKLFRYWDWDGCHAGPPQPPISFEFLVIELSPSTRVPQHLVARSVASG